MNMVNILDYRELDVEQSPGMLVIELEYIT